MNLDRPDALKVLRDMLTIRATEEAILHLSQSGDVAGSVHLCFGQEAIPVGVRAALGVRDRVITTYRGHGWALAWGCTPEEVIAESAHKADGMNSGRAGSLLMAAPDRGLLAANSIVGAGTVVAAGVALAQRKGGSRDLTVVSFGDGALNQGAVSEAFAFALTHSLPMIFVCENNGWSEMTPTGDIIPAKDLTERAKGFGIESYVVNGQDPFDVHRATAIAAETCRAGNGPVFMECKTYRLRGHYNRDIEHYRAKADIELAAANDPIPLLKERLLRDAVATADELTAIEHLVGDDVRAVVAKVQAMEPADTSYATAHLYAPMAGTAQADSPDAKTSATLKEMTYQRALNSALRVELETRPEVLVYGEDVGKPGGVHGVTRSLQKQFGTDRVFDTAISESAILGSALGAAISGMRPIIEIMWADFMFVAFDQVINQLSNVSYLSEGRQTAPVTIRTQQGVSPGSCAQHSQSIEAFLAHVPGIKVGLAATAQDAYSMLRAAVADPNPVVLIENRNLYQETGQVREAETVEPVHGARIRRDGSDLTIVSWGQTVGTCVAAADQLDREGVSATVVDLRWLRPLDDNTLRRAVAATGGKVLIVHEDFRYGGFGAEVYCSIHELLGHELSLKIRRLGMPDTRIPAAPGLQSALIPSQAEVVRAAHEILEAC